MMVPLFGICINCVSLSDRRELFGCCHRHPRFQSCGFSRTLSPTDCRYTPLHPYSSRPVSLAQQVTKETSGCHGRRQGYRGERERQSTGCRRVSKGHNRAQRQLKRRWTYNKYAIIFIMHSSSTCTYQLAGSVKLLCDADHHYAEATRAEMSAAKVPLPYRDTCAHLLIPLNKCRYQNYYLPWRCEVSGAANHYAGL